MEKQTKPEKSYTIFVNSREKTWNDHKISYVDVIKLAFGTYDDNPKVSYTVTYSKGQSDQKGSLVKDGKDVTIKDGMIFDVTKTDES